MLSYRSLGTSTRYESRFWTGADALVVQVDAGDVEAGLRESHRERKAGIAEPDDPDRRGALGDALVEGRFR